MSWERLFIAALQDLYRAAQEYNEVRSQYPRLPNVRVPAIRVSAQLIWPAVTHSGKVDLAALSRPSHAMLPRCWCAQCAPLYVAYPERVVEVLREDTGQHPRDLLRALRRIQAAAAWCRARTAGLQRALEEVARQQARAVEALETEAAVRTLAGWQP
jgi:hypothetical protein